MSAPESPAHLQFRLRDFVEHESSDDFLQGAGDEVFVSAIGLDSAAVVVGPDRKPAATPINSGRVGDISEDAVRNPWRTAPHVLLEFDLSRPSGWPRSFSVTILIVEHDNADLGEVFAKLQSEVGGAVKEAAVKAASAAAGAAAGAAIGSVFPGAGTAIGAAVGGLAGAGYDEIIHAIAEGLDDEVFTPRPLVLEARSPAQLKQHADIGRPSSIEINEHGAKYSIEYDWNITVGRWPRRQAPVTAIKTRAEDGHCTLFVTGSDGRVWTNFWPKPDTTDWFGWFPVGENTFPVLG